MSWHHMIRNPMFWTMAWTAFLLSTAFLWIIWYLALFSPVYVVQSAIEVQGRQYTVTIFSHKTRLANTLCGKPLRESTVIAFQDEDQNHAVVIDNAKGYGNGDEQVRKWVSTGRIPDNIRAGPVVAWKRLYICALAASSKKLKRQKCRSF